MKPYHERAPITQYADAGRMKSVSLLPATSVSAKPKVGAVIFDGSSNTRRVREFRTISATFDPVRLWSITNVRLSREFIIHDDDAIYLDGSIDSGAYRGAYSARIHEHFANVLAESTDSISHQYADISALVLHNEGGGTWGHFLIQNLPKLVAFLDRFPEGKVALPLALSRMGQSTFVDALILAGVKQEQIIPLETGVTYVFGELFLVDPIYSFQAHIPHPFALDVFDAMTMNISANMAQKIFVERTGAPPERLVSNQAEVDAVLNAHGVGKAAAGTLPFQQQVSLWKSAELAIATLGSDFTNIVFCRPGTKLLSLSPDWFGDAFFYHIAIMKGLVWNELRCGQMVEEAQIAHRSSFVVDIELLDNLISTFG